MWQVEIKNTLDELTNSAKFATEAEADAWIATQQGLARPWGYQSASDYTVTKTDITTEVSRTAKEKQRQKKRMFGGMVIDRVAVINEAKSLTAQQIQDLSTSFELPVKLLLQGDITTAKTVIQGLDLAGSVFTEAERTEVLALIDEYIAAV